MTKKKTMYCVLNGFYFGFYYCDMSSDGSNHLIVEMNYKDVSILNNRFSSYKYLASGFNVELESCISSCHDDFVNCYHDEACIIVIKIIGHKKKTLKQQLPIIHDLAKNQASVISNTNYFFDQLF